MTDPWEEQERHEQQWAYEDALREENEKLRELVRSVLVLRHDSVFKWLDAATAEVYGISFTAKARELGIEVDG